MTAARAVSMSDRLGESVYNHDPHHDEPDPEDCWGVQALSVKEPSDHTNENHSDGGPHSIGDAERYGSQRKGEEVERCAVPGNHQ